MVEMLVALKVVLMA
jgi:hypothetical protein